MLLKVLSFILCAQIAFADPLPSWNEGAAKAAILDFVKGIENIPEEDRIAVFDQDGTLWVEQPMYVQLFFAIDQIKKIQPDYDLEGKNFTLPQIEKLVVETHAGMTVDQFHEEVQQWLKKAVHPRFKKPFTELVYRPMLEVMQLLESNGFRNYIVSGGGQEFMRSYAQPVYGVPLQRVIGSTGKVKYQMLDGKPVLMKQPEVWFKVNYAGKPEAINLFMGKRPLAAFGNSDGDRQMLEWTQGGDGKHFELLVHHDDAEREYAYGPNTKYGVFSDELMAEARKNGWTVVSMKNDWKVIWPDTPSIIDTSSDDRRLPAIP